MDASRFSERFGFRPHAPEIHIRDSAPQELRDAALQIATEASFAADEVRSITCRVLRVVASEYNHAGYEILSEVAGLLRSAEWYEFYDIVEAISAEERARGGSRHFADEINNYFRQKGVGWQITDGALEARGSEDFELAVRTTMEVLEKAHMRTALGEFHEARVDLSRRPKPDLTGSVQHALAGLECIARDVVGMNNLTLGPILKRHPTLLPAPLNTVVDRIWGYASETARHLKSDRAIQVAEAELLVSVASAAATYLVRRLDNLNGG